MRRVQKAKSKTPKPKDPLLDRSLWLPVEEAYKQEKARFIPNAFPTRLPDVVRSSAEYWRTVRTNLHADPKLPPFQLKQHLQSIVGSAKKIERLLGGIGAQTFFTLARLSNMTTPPNQDSSDRYPSRQVSPRDGGKDAGREPEPLAWDHFIRPLNTFCYNLAQLSVAAEHVANNLQPRRTREKENVALKGFMAELAGCLEHFTGKPFGEKAKKMRWLAIKPIIEAVFPGTSDKEIASAWRDAANNPVRQSTLVRLKWEEAAASARARGYAYCRFDLTDSGQVIPGPVLGLEKRPRRSKKSE
jgi:hypothetical protein